MIWRFMSSKCSWTLFHCREASRVKELRPKVVVLTFLTKRRLIWLALVSMSWGITVKVKVERQSDTVVSVNQKLDFRRASKSRSTERRNRNSKWRPSTTLKVSEKHQFSNHHKKLMQTDISLISFVKYAWTTKDSIQIKKYLFIGVNIPNIYNCQGTLTRSDQFFKWLYENVDWQLWLEIFTETSKYQAKRNAKWYKS